MMEEYSEDEEMAACTMAICASVIHQREKSCKKETTKSGVGPGLANAEERLQHDCARA